MLAVGGGQDRPRNDATRPATSSMLSATRKVFPSTSVTRVKGGDSLALSIRSAFMATAAPVPVVKTTIATTSFCLYRLRACHGRNGKATATTGCQSWLRAGCR